MIGNFEVICGSKIEHFNNETPLLDYIKTLTEPFTVLDKDGNDVTSRFIPTKPKVEKEKPKEVEIAPKPTFPKRKYPKTIDDF